MKFRKVICLAAMSLFFASVYAYESAGAGIMRVYFLDIGQGDAAYIRTPGGRDMLIDGGVGKVILEKLGEAMPFHDRSIDVVVATHPDADHIGGLPHVLERYEVRYFIEPGIESKNAIDDEIHRLIREKGIPREVARAGMAIDFGDGVSFDVIYPDSDISNLSDTNEASIVGQLRYGSTTVMLTGDASKRIEGRLLSYGDTIRSDVLKAGHHGSRTSSGEDFVKAVSPKWAVISAGKKNRYGHPHTEVLDIFKRFGITALGTYDAGTILFESDGREIKNVRP